MWLNENEEMRDLGSKRAEELNDQYKKIIRERSHLYPNFKMQYQPFPIENLFKEFKKKNIPVKDLIEPFDGFHPSQIAQNLISQVIWDTLIKEYPDAAGPINPNNELIDRLFNQTYQSSR